jgi:hypothetical protein
VAEGVVVAEGVAAAAVVGAAVVVEAVVEEAVSRYFPPAAATPSHPRLGRVTTG